MSNVTAVQEMELERPPESTTRSILSPPETDHSSKWFSGRRLAAWQRFEALPMPNRKDQAWRFSNVDALDLTPFEARPAPDHHAVAGLLSKSSGLDDNAARLVFADDHLLEESPLSPRLLEQGVLVQPFERALREHEALFSRYFMSDPAVLGSAKFAALHEARVRSGVLVYVPRGVEVELPIEVFHWLDAANSSAFPHLLLVADEMAKVTVMEHFRSNSPGAAGFACGVNDLIAGKGEEITYVCAQDWGRDVIALQMNTTRVERDASVISLNVNLGARYSRFESLSKLEGENSRSDLLAIAVADGRQEFDARTLQDHFCPHSTSDLLYKNALQDRARTTFGGLIRVEPHAHFTDAYQTVRNLLLSDDAEANSMPGLEILADNVKCSHGATSGQINEEEMFYLLARGIPPAAARELLVAGFLHEVVDRINQPEIAERVHDLIDAKFARHRAVVL